MAPAVSAYAFTWDPINSQSISRKFLCCLTPADVKKPSETAWQVYSNLQESQGFDPQVLALLW